MRSGGDWKGEIQGTEETEHAIPVMKRSREHDPGACQCCKSGRECVDDQYNTLPVSDRRRSCARAEDVMRAGSTQKSPCALQGGRNDWHKYSARGFANAVVQIVTAAPIITAAPTRSLR